jgi:hypothetical protein
MLTECLYAQNLFQFFVSPISELNGNTKCRRCVMRYQSFQTLNGSETRNFEIWILRPCDDTEFCEGDFCGGE